MNNTYAFSLFDTHATEQLGQQLAAASTAPSIFYLLGDLGAGKTTLTRGFLSALGHHGAVKSPTYTLIEPYQLGEHNIYHLDLYRLGDPEELEYLGLRDLLVTQARWLIEWPERGHGMLPAADIELHLQYDGQGRTAELRAMSTAGEAILQQLVS